jgi:hypothetical protein
MTVYLSSFGGVGWQFFDGNGQPLSGGKIFSFEAGTTIPAPTYTDDSGTTTHTNPIVLTSVGRVPSGQIWQPANPPYKFVLYTSDDILIGTFDDVAPITPPQASAIVYNQGSSGAIDRGVEDRLNDNVFVSDFGFTGAKIADAIAASSSVTFSPGTYANSDTAITLPFGKALRFDAGATLTTSGGGTTDFVGTVIHENYNPSGSTGFNAPWAGQNFQGFGVDVGGYGPTSFGPWNKFTAINGSLSVPASATIFGGFGVAGYVENAAPSPNGPNIVGIYGQADRRADNALVWGMNSRTIDNGFGGLNIWGYECNLNIDNVTTTGLGIDLVGGSTVEPNLSTAVNIQAIGVFSTPKKRWTYGLRTVAASCVVGVQIGPDGDGANRGSQPFHIMYSNSTGLESIAMSAISDSLGNMVLTGGGDATRLFALKTPGSTDANIQLQNDGVGFFGAFPTTRRVVSGSRGGNAALASLLTALGELGLIEDTTTA